MQTQKHNEGPEPGARTLRCRNERVEYSSPYAIPRLRTLRKDLQPTKYVSVLYESVIIHCSLPVLRKTPAKHFPTAQVCLQVHFFTSCRSLRLSSRHSYASCIPTPRMLPPNRRCAIHPYLVANTFTTLPSSAIVVTKSLIHWFTLDKEQQ